MSIVTRFYRSRARPLEWIIEDNRSYYVVPACPGGWHFRRPYRGDTQHLHRLRGPRTLARIMRMLTAHVNPIGYYLNEEGRP